MKSLSRDGLLKIMLQSGIEYLNILGTTDLNSPIADPEYLGYLNQSKKDFVVHAYRRENANINYS
jgi:UDP-N-acetylglucosamine pyrophosphorylase